MTGRRVFYYAEINRLIIAENILNAYHARAASQNWTNWANENPKQAETLAEAERLYASSTS